MQTLLYLLRIQMNRHHSEMAEVCLVIFGANFVPAASVVFKHITRLAGVVDASLLPSSTPQRPF